jgi:hypothetical protein
VAHLALASAVTAAPKPEHPRPDWQRNDWHNLNGTWRFRFDTEDKGKSEQWQRRDTESFPDTIIVPFSWVSPLSGIGKDEKGAAWYFRSVQWSPERTGDGIILKFGAVDYHCEIWINGQFIGTHSGGYGSFEFDVTGAWDVSGENRITIRVEDQDESFQARGKQGYGEIRGIWQTVWLEARPVNYIKSLRFITRIDGTVEVSGRIGAAIAGPGTLKFSFKDDNVKHRLAVSLSVGDNDFSTSLKVDNPQLWSPEQPFLYEGCVTLENPESLGSADQVSTYFGIREIGTTRHEGRDYRWITLNGKPIFLSGALDQSFHPEGYFTYPTDDEMQDEIWRLKRLGLNFVRIHIKPEEPRKLYWADKLGILVMEDMPCFWGEPNEQARHAYEAEARETMQRDFNHPSIFSWVMFNETWGLFTAIQEGKRRFLPETQDWVREVYRWAKQEDPSRLVEDNSPCNYDHVETDLNTWHFYKNGYKNVRDHIQEVVDQTHPGSTFNYIGGIEQSDAPLMNSECGAVWGIEGSAGDSDIAWHYRYMINQFRRHDQMCGFVFTEFRDVINEFNGYYRIDGSDKDFGYDAFHSGMSLRDLHSPDFVVIDAPPCATVEAGQEVSVPLLRSSYSDRYHGETLRLTWELGYDHLGEKTIAEQGTAFVEWNAYGVSPLTQVNVRMPSCDAVAVFAVTLRSAKGETITRNFITFDVRSGSSAGRYNIEGEWMSIPPQTYARKQWDYSWNALSGHKANGGGAGFFEYDVQLPELQAGRLIGHLELFFEAGAKQVLDKDKEMIDVNPHDISYMHGAKVNPGMNINSYFMTDERKHPTTVEVIVDGIMVDRLNIEDDPADSRGVLSWHYQTADNRLEEAGSYGYLHKVTIPSLLVASIIRRGSFRLRLQIPDQLPEGSGGLALYGRNAGRYPIDILVAYR